jgi:hypothetical protein
MCYDDKLNNSKHNRVLSFLILLLMGIVFQFPNLPIPGRFTFILFGLILITLIFNRYIKFIKTQVIFCLGINFYLIIISCVSILCTINAYDWNLTSILKQFLYYQAYLFLFCSAGVFIYALNRFNAFNTFIVSHIIYFAIGYLLILGINMSFLNAKDMIVEGGRLAITENEPSVATLRVVFVLFLSSLLMKSNKPLALLLVVASVVLLFYIRSKSTIFLLPISIAISGVFYIMLSSMEFSRKLKVLIYLTAILVFIIALAVNSTYFYYAYHFTFIDQTGSALSRLIFFKTGLDLIIENPFGYGFAFQPFFKDALQLNILQNAISNSELRSLFNTHDMDTMLSPKSGIITIGIVGGVPLVLVFISIFYKTLTKIYGSTLGDGKKISIGGFLIFMLIYSFVSEVNASFILYLSIIYFWVGSTNKVNSFEFFKK